MWCLTRVVIVGAFWFVSSAVAGELPSTTNYELVVLNGRVMDPETGLDAIRSIGISHGRIEVITADRLAGRRTIDAQGLVVAPGFIDLHQHGQDDENYRVKAMDGVTTALELELGTADIDAWYAEREGHSLINYGVSVGHPAVRSRVMHDLGKSHPVGDAAHKIASDAEIEQMKGQIEDGLRRGAIGVGFGVAYTPAASSWEILEMFRIAARYGAVCYVHPRRGLDPEQGVEEVLAAAAITGAPLHIVHIQSTGTTETPHLLEMIREARARGLDVTTEMYPYAAGMTEIASALFDDWQNYPESEFQKFFWPKTGEWLTRQSFGQYRKSGGMVVIFDNTDEIVTQAVHSPLTMIASDGFIEQGRGHPRTAGTYSRILGHYVREMQTISLIDALRKMSLMPANRLETRVPIMRNKGRIRVGADADLAIFDEQRVTDMSTYQHPAASSQGMRFVLVRGIPVVSDGQMQTDVFPGGAVRAPQTSGGIL
jgi:N-acyl-D-aspartate/D-glutamate deacylase